MRLNILHLTTLWTALAGVVNAGNYMFDASCDATPGMLDFVRSTFTNALTMSQAAYDAVTATPIDPVVQGVLASLVSPVNPVTSTPVQFAVQIFGPIGINRLRTEVDENNFLGTNDVKVYCDQTRLKQRATGEWIDHDVDRVDEQHIRCRLLFNPNYALMYTTHNAERLDSLNNVISGESFHQIQICPQFLQWALPLKGNLNTVLLPNILWNKITVSLGKQIESLTKFTPIDGVSLFDKVMLHELTHATTKSVQTVDVDVDGGVAYGWRLCTALSTSDSTGAGAAQNSDTWALFGSIAWQLQQGLIAGVNADGTIIHVDGDGCC